MGQDVTNQTRFCQIPQSSKKGLNRHLKPKTIFMAVGLSFILTTSLVYYLMLSPALPISPPIPPTPPTPQQFTPHGAIAIDGDANFSDAALLEGWPGDGTPENPFIIDGLEIDVDGAFGYCIAIGNTQVSFIIRNSNFTGAPRYVSLNSIPGVGISLYNVSNGELVNNIFNNNDGVGIFLYRSDYNTLMKNTCNSNGGDGIFIKESNYTTVVNNTCNSNEGNGIFLEGQSYSNSFINNTCNNNNYGIYLEGSDSTVVSNTCSNNTESGILLHRSHFNTVAKNTCNYNRIGIHLYSSDSNYVYSNSCLGNCEHDTVDEFETEDDSKTPIVLWLTVSIGYIAFMVFILLSGLIVGNRVSKEK